jgi:hypothetical protein
MHSAVKCSGCRSAVALVLAPVPSAYPGGWGLSRRPSRSATQSRLPSERPQQIVDIVIDDRPGPTREGYYLVGVLTVHVGAVDRKEHHNHQGYPEQAHSRTVSQDYSHQVKQVRGGAKPCAGNRLSVGSLPI